MSGFADDRTSGSSRVAGAFLDELERWAATDTSTRPEAFRGALLGWLRAAQAAQPSMALVHQFAARALDVADTGLRRGDAVPELRAQLAASAAAERGDLAAAIAGVARMAAELPGGREDWIATLSDSAAVGAGFLELARRGRAPRALVAESRPRYEGRVLAATLAAAGIPVWLVADAALPMLIAHAAQVWLGADAVTERGVINKTGSFALALAAREHSVPVHALAPRRKFLPAATAALRIVEMPPAEIWADPAPGVQPRNVTFELVPLALLRGVVVEDAVLGPTEVQITAADRALPEELGGAPARDST